MDLIIIVLICVIVGFLVYLLTTNVPMPPLYARAIQVGVLVILLLWVVSKFVAIPNLLPR